MIISLIGLFFEIINMSRTSLKYAQDIPLSIFLQYSCKSMITEKNESSPDVSVAPLSCLL